MSWDATLVDGNGSPINEWNYTHNTNRMIAEALRVADGVETPQCRGPLGPAIGPAWWYALDGASAAAGRDYLTTIISGLEADPDYFRNMNPDNGWGDYDQLLTVLREMRDLSAAHSACNSEWVASG